MMEPTTVSKVPAVSSGRLKFGIALFGLSILVPLIGVPALALLGLSAGLTASVTGGLLVAAEIIGVVSVAVMGKQGFAALKNWFLGFFKRYGPPQSVSRLRYKIGLVMFSVPILFALVSGYAGQWIPYFVDNPLMYALGGDIMLLTSLFVLGGNFWDKIRSLFVHDAVARFPLSSREDADKSV
jgi:hypothetical protein